MLESVKEKYPDLSYSISAAPDIVHSVDFETVLVQRQDSRSSLLTGVEKE